LANGKTSAIGHRPTAHRYGLPCLGENKACGHEKEGIGWGKMKQEENSGKNEAGPLAPKRVAARVLGVTEFSERAKANLKSQLPSGAVRCGPLPREIVHILP